MVQQGQVPRVLGGVANGVLPQADEIVLQRRGEFFGIHCGLKCLFASTVRIFTIVLLYVRHVHYVFAIHSEMST